MLKRPIPLVLCPVVRHFDNPRCLCWFRAKEQALQRTFCPCVLPLLRSRDKENAVLREVALNGVDVHVFGQLVCAVDLPLHFSVLVLADVVDCMHDQVTLVNF